MKLSNDLDYLFQQLKRVIDNLNLKNSGVSLKKMTDILDKIEASYELKGMTSE